MANESSTIVQRLWNYCNVLRDDGGELWRLCRAVDISLVPENGR